MSAIDARADPAAFHSALLSWYDRSARALPWRVPPGSNERPDPYRIWLSEIMLQQTVVKTVIPYFETFIARWPTVEALAAAPDEEVLSAWAGLGYYARARNLLACAREVTARGAFPDTEEGLLSLPGIGPYTAAAIAAIAFGRPAAVVDGNIERVMARLFAIETPLPAAKPALKQAAADLTPDHRPGDHAQALMDLGAGICRPKTALCLACPVGSFCAARGHDPERLPAKAPKAERPLRRGIVYWAESDGDVLLVRRPAKGLLGGMTALPASEFADTAPDLGAAAPFPADWTLTGASVNHGFTHFRLQLDIASVDLPERPETEGEWVPRHHLADAGLPTLFQKAVRAAAALR